MFINTKKYLVARKLAATNIWWEKEQPDHLLCWTSEEDKKLKVLSRITIPWRHPVKSACKENGTYLGPLSDFGDWVTIWSIELMLLASIQGFIPMDARMHGLGWGDNDDHVLNTPSKEQGVVMKTLEDKQEV